MARGPLTKRSEQVNPPCSDGDVEIEDAERLGKRRAYSIPCSRKLYSLFQHAAMRSAKRKLLENPGKLKTQVRLDSLTSSSLEPAPQTESSTKRVRRRTAT